MSRGNAIKAIRVKTIILGIVMVCASSYFLSSQRICDECGDWLTTENVGSIVLPPNSTAVLTFHYDGSDKEYQRLMKKIWVAQMFYHELAAPLLKDRHLIVTLRTRLDSNATFGGLAMSVVDHLQLSKNVTMVTNFPAPLIEKNGTKEADMRLPILPGLYQSHHQRYPDLRYLEFFVVLKNPAVYAATVTYDLSDILVVRTPYNYRSVIPILAVMSIAILLLLATAALSLRSYASFLLSRLSSYFPDEISRSLWARYQRLSKWMIPLNSLLLVPPIVEIIGALYRTGFWAPSIRIVSGDIYPEILMKHDYVDYLLLAEADFSVRVHIMKGFIDLLPALFLLHAVILLLAMHVYLSHLRKIRLNRYVQFRTYSIVIISMSVLLLSPVLLLLTLGTELARYVLASSPASLVLDAITFEKFRSLVFDRSLELSLIYEPSLGYLLVFPFVLMAVLSWGMMGSVLYGKWSKSVLGSAEAVNAERARYGQNLKLLVVTWAVVQAVLIAVSRSLGPNVIYSFLLALVVPYLRDFLERRHLTSEEDFPRHFS